jgi:hypothetical protein
VVWIARFPSMRGRRCVLSKITDHAAGGWTSGDFLLIEHPRATLLLTWRGVSTRERESSRGLASNGESNRHGCGRDPEVDVSESRAPAEGRDCRKPLWERDLRDLGGGDLRAGAVNQRVIAIPRRNENSPSRTRTCNLAVNSRSLYH